MRLRRGNMQGTLQLTTSKLFAFNIWDEID